MAYLVFVLLNLVFGAIDYSSSANGGLRNVIYYGDWSVWGGQDNFYPASIAGDQLTHLNFAFLDFDANGELIFTDGQAAYENPLGISGITWGDANAGVLPAFQELRAKNPNLRLGVSLGGWSKSADFTAVGKDAKALANFVDQVGRFVEYNNFDFIDVDWEYPGSVRDPDLCDNKNDEGTPYASPEDGKYFIQLLEALKAKEAELSKKNNRTYELTAALPAAVGNFENGAQAFLPTGVTKATATPDQIQAASTEYVQRLFDILDFGNLMTYDMRGAWDPVSGHHAGLYTHLSGDADTDEVGFSADALVSYLLGKTTDSKGNALKAVLSKGVPAEKLVIGAAFYSRGWAQVSNNGPEATKYPGLFGTAAAVGTDADNTPSRGAQNAVITTQGDAGRLGGVWPYGKLTAMKSALKNLKYFYDDIAEAPYFYDESGGAFISYDSPKSIAAKTAYVKKNGLGGIISWMVSQDATTGDEENGQYTTGGVRSALTKDIKEGLWGTAPLELFNIGAPIINIQCNVSTAVENGRESFHVDILNNFVNSETNIALEAAAKAAGTLSSPKIYITLRSGITITGGGGYGSGTVSQTGNLVTINFTEYELQRFVPGTLANIVLLSSNTGLATADIEKVEVGKFIYANGAEAGRAVVYPKA